MATDYKGLVDSLTNMAETASKAKEAAADSVEVKAARAGSTFYHFVKTEGFPLPMPEDVEVYVNSVRALGPTAADRSEGDTIAQRLGKLLALDADDRPDAFNSVAEAAEAAFQAWHGSAPRKGRPSGSGDGASTTPPSQLLATDNLKAVHVTMTLPDGTTKDVEHGSTWSSLSNEVNKVVKAVIGADAVAAVEAKGDRVSYGKLDPKARDSWREAVKALKAGNLGPHAFTVHTGEAGDVEVSMTGIASAVTTPAETPASA